MNRHIDVEALCQEKGLRITDQRRVIAKVLSESTDHPDVEKLHERAVAVDPHGGVSHIRVFQSRTSTGLMHLP